MQRIAVTALVLVLGLAMSASPARAGSRGPFGDAGRPKPLLVRALDANGNGVVEAAEIANAGVVLKTLDQDGDGRLVADELMPRRSGDAPPLQPSPFGGGNPRRPAPPEGAKLSQDPVFKALDTDANGELDATEIANAGVALKALDANRDGALDREELRPAAPPGGKGNRGPFGRQ